MKFVYCFTFIFLIEIYNIGQIKSQGTSDLEITLDREDERVRKSDIKYVHKFLYDYRHNGHVSNIEIGSSLQQIKIQYSTASAHSWMFSTEYDNCSPNKTFLYQVKTLYNHPASLNYQFAVEEEAEFIEDGDNWALGYVVHDTFKIKLNGQHLKEFVTSEKFLEIMKASEEFTQMKADGVISLQYNRKGELDFVTKICNSLYRPSMFAFAFQRKQINRIESDRGILNLCGIDNSVYRENSFIYVNDVSTGHWTFILPEISMYNGIDRVVTISSGNVAVFDTTTDRIYAPELPAYIIYSLIKADSIPNYPHKMHIDCNKLQDTPALRFHIKQRLFRLSAVDYTKKITYPDQKDYCEVLIVPTKEENWILGDTFLRAFYTVFDITNRRIGFGDYETPVAPV